MLLEHIKVGTCTLSSFMKLKKSKFDDVMIEARQLVAMMKNSDFSSSQSIVRFHNNILNK